MVIPDWSAIRPPKVEFQPAEVATREAFARPVDRLAAVIVDVFVLLVPLFILLSAPFKRWMTASFILGSDPDFFAMIGMMVVLGVLMLVTYQAVMHRFFGATVGKMIFDLRVRPVFAETQTSFAAQVLRAFVWTFEILLLGLPLLAVFSNSKRRVLHDRVSDTIVVTRGRAGVLAPAIWERGLVRGFFAFCLLFLATVASFEAQHLWQHSRAERGLSAVLERDGASCEAVSRNMEGEPKGHSRLDMAMGLYAAGLVDRDCLESEIGRETAVQTPVGAVTYLAQAFVNADDAEVSNSYLDQVCEDAPGSVECTMSQVVSKWSEEDWDSVENLLDKGKKGSGYLEVWGVRHFMKQGHYDQALAFLDRLSEHHELADFSLVQRVKALYDSHHESEADVALAQALPAVSHDEASDVSAWLCAQQLQSGCAALEKPACKDVRSAEHTVREIDFEHTSEALSQVMALECQKGEKVDYLSFSESVRDEDWQNFFRANLKEQKSDRQASFSLFTDVISSPTAPDLIRVEALRRVAEFADIKQLDSLVDLWQGIESREAWNKAGNILFTHMAAKNDAKSALRVAHELIAAQAMAPQSLALMSHMDGQGAEMRRPASVPTRKVRGHK